MSSPDREVAAEEWLIRCNQAPTPERIAELASYTGVLRGGMQQGRIADQLVSEGRVPDPESVQQQLRVNEEFRQARVRKRREKRAAAALNLTNVEALAVCQWIVDYESEHGMSPLWSELKTPFGWNNEQLNGTLLSLKRRGWVTYTRLPRSLRVGRRYKKNLEAGKKL